MLCPKTWALNELNRRELNRNRALPKVRVPTKILQSEAEFGVWGVMIKHKDAQGNYPWSPPTKPNSNTSESKEQAAHENPTKIAWKRHGNHTSYKRESTHPWKLPFTRRSDSLQTGKKSKPMEQGNEKQSGRIVCVETLELIYMSPSRPGKRPCYP
jgi:hypothetical protein